MTDQESPPTLNTSSHLEIEVERRYAALSLAANAPIANVLDRDVEYVIARARAYYDFLSGDASADSNG